MVRSTLAMAGAPCPVKLAHAAWGKRARAEPVAALYEQGRVTRCAPDLAMLEEEPVALGASDAPSRGQPGPGRTPWSRP